MNNTESSISAEEFNNLFAEIGLCTQECIAKTDITAGDYLKGKDNMRSMFFPEVTEGEIVGMSQI